MLTQLVRPSGKQNGVILLPNKCLSDMNLSLSEKRNKNLGKAEEKEEMLQDHIKKNKFVPITIDQRGTHTTTLPPLPPDDFLRGHHGRCKLEPFATPTLFILSSIP